MNSHRCRAVLLSVLVCLGSLLPVAGADTVPSNAAGIRVMLIYGGHDFETNQFLKVFRDNPEITLATAEYPAAEAWFEPARARDYDVLVFYDMWQKLSPGGKSNLVALIQGGKPLVAMHHTLAASQSWDEYANIIGGKYHETKWRKNGVEQPKSTYQHDVDFTVHIADREHPVTQGIQDFTIHDETYGGFDVHPDSHVLLTVNAPTSGRDIAWTKTYGTARVIYLQLGHDHQAFENANYQRLVRQAIRWVAAGNAVPKR